MTRPEDQARERIDQRLSRAGWSLQDMASVNPGAARGVAVREYPTDSGPADYVLLLDRQPVGVIEAKRDDEGERLTVHEVQTDRYCQVAAVRGLEAALAANRPRLLVHMATGAGKTFTAITAVYRLLKFGGARRVLILVDTRNLGKQAHQEFMAYQPADDARKFTELYGVQRLAGAAIDPHAQVVISTIQRMYANDEPASMLLERIRAQREAAPPSKPRRPRRSAPMASA